MKRRILLCLSVAMCTLTSMAQEKYQLTLDQCIDIAKDKSFSMLKLKQNLERTEHNLQATVRSLRTKVDLSMELPSFRDDVVQWNDSLGVSYYSQKQLGYSADLMIRQPLPTDGSIYILNSLSTIDDMRRDVRSSSTRTRIGFEQPFDAFYGYNNIRSALKRAKLAHESSSKSLKREELNLIYNVSSSYYNLLSLQEQTKIAQLDLERQTEAQEISKNKFEAGLIREVDALQMEVDLAEAQSNHDIAILNQEASLNRFKELLGIGLEDEIELNSDLSYDVVIVDHELAIQLALEHRLELREQDIQIELQRLNIKQQKAARMVKANLNVYYEQAGVWQDRTMTDPATQEVLHVRKDLFPSIGSAYSNYKDRPASYGIGFTLNIPILDWGENRSRVRAAESQLKEIEYTKQEVERSIETEVKSLVSTINSNLKRLQLLEKNVVVAEKSFNITLQRYTDGDIDSEALALERKRMNTAYTSKLSAYINYQLSLADLMRKTFFDFKTNTLIE